jgi:hypothetical protein
VTLKGHIMDYTIEDNQKLLKERLKNGTVLVSFTKKDGERRDMLCTLQEAQLPERPQTDAEKTSTRPASTTSLSVFDTEKQAWRSFRWDSIVEVK